MAMIYVFRCEGVQEGADASDGSCVIMQSRLRGWRAFPSARRSHLVRGADSRSSIARFDSRRWNLDEKHPLDASQQQSLT